MGHLWEKGLTFVLASLKVKSGTQDGERNDTKLMSCVKWHVLQME